MSSCVQRPSRPLSLLVLAVLVASSGCTAGEVDQVRCNDRGSLAVGAISLTVPRQALPFDADVCLSSSSVKRRAPALPQELQSVVPPVHLNVRGGRLLLPVHLRASVDARWRGKEIYWAYSGPNKSWRLVSGTSAGRSVSVDTMYTSWWQPVVPRSRLPALQRAVVWINNLALADQRFTPQPCPSRYLAWALPKTLGGPRPFLQVCVRGATPGSPGAIWRITNTRLNGLLLSPPVAADHVSLERRPEPRRLSALAGRFEQRAKRSLRGPLYLGSGDTAVFRLGRQGGPGVFSSKLSYASFAIDLFSAFMGLYTGVNPETLYDNSRRCVSFVAKLGSNTSTDKSISGEMLNCVRIAMTKAAKGSKLDVRRALQNGDQLLRAIQVSLESLETRLVGSQQSVIVPERRLSDASRLRVDGLGPVAVGMTLEEMKWSSGVKLVKHASDHGSCQRWLPAGAKRSPTFTLLKGRVARIEVFGDSVIKTDRDLGIGAPQDALVRLYEGGNVTRHTYLPNGWFYIAPLRSEHVDFGFTFETSKGKIVGMRAGRADVVVKPEGCAEGLK
jgi:hypothetical protein